MINLILQRSSCTSTVNESVCHLHYIYGMPSETYAELNSTHLLFFCFFKKSYLVVMWVIFNYVEIKIVIVGCIYFYQLFIFKLICFYCWAPCGGNQSAERDAFILKTLVYIKIILLCTSDLKQF